MEHALALSDRLNALFALVLLKLHAPFVDLRTNQTLLLSDPISAGRARYILPDNPSFVINVVVLSGFLHDRLLRLSIVGKCRFDLYPIGSCSPVLRPPYTLLTGIGPAAAQSQCRPRL